MAFCYIAIELLLFQKKKCLLGVIHFQRAINNWYITPNAELRSVNLVSAFTKTRRLMRTGLSPLPKFPQQQQRTSSALYLLRLRPPLPFRRLHFHRTGLVTQPAPKNSHIRTQKECEALGQDPKTRPGLKWPYEFCKQSQQMGFRSDTHQTGC